MIPPSGPVRAQRRREMKKVYIVALALVASAAAGPALAGECPALHAQMDKALGQRYDSGAANAKIMTRDANALHQAGKHEESVKKYEEAAKAANVTLQKKQR
jgi:hypothetical protein